jgi:hypothetical protein
MSGMSSQAQRNNAEMRKRELLREARNNAKGLEAADAAYVQGDIRVATLIYLHIAASRPQNKLTQTARQRLDHLRAEAREKLEQIDALLESSSKVVEAFDRYEKLTYDYGLVPVIGQEIRDRVANQRNASKFVSILKEDEASRWWELGQACEKKQELCCAYLAYEQSERLAPAPAARLARNRLSSMKQDPATIAAAEDCRTLQWCHDTYRRAEQLIKGDPEQARNLLAQIIQKAPHDSEVYRAAVERAK